MKFSASEMPPLPFTFSKEYDNVDNAAAEARLSTDEGRTSNPGKVRAVIKKSESSSSEANKLPAFQQQGVLHKQQRRNSMNAKCA